MDEELQRLLACRLTPEEALIASAYYRATWTAESRAAYHAAHPENFAGPGTTYPIKDGSDVNDAARLAGHAQKPGKVRRRIIAIARRLGLSAHLPASWKSEAGISDKTEKERYLAALNDPSQMPRAVSYEEDEDEDDTDQGTDADSDADEDEDDNSNQDEQAENDEQTSAGQQRAQRGMTPAAPDHDMMHGRHTHHHAHMDGYAHAHTHEHVGEADHEHTHEHHARRSREYTPEQLVHLFAPIVRSDATKHEVFGQATTEKPDAYGTIFGYNPDAWKRWRGNIREQHDPHKAVGRAVALEFDDDEHSVYVGSKISRGAQDTWLKVEDSVLTGYSVSILPAEEYGSDPRKWPKRAYNGKEYPFLPEYDVVELSLVDNPATPGCDIAVVRAGGFINSEVLDNSTEETPPTTIGQPAAQPETLERAGSRISGETRESLHAIARNAMQTCCCPDCQRAMDAHNNTESSEMNGTTSGERMIEATLERALAPVVAREQAFFTQLSKNPGYFERALETARTQIETTIAETIDRAIAQAVDKLTSQDKERASQLETVKALVAQIAEQPASGGPLLNGAANASPNASSTERALAAIRDLQNQGVALSPIQQQALATVLFKPL